MESAPLFVLAASLGVTVGWQPLESDPSRYELIVATPPAVVDRLDEIDLAQLVAEVPADIAPIGRVRVLATDQPAPREQLVTLLKPVIESPQVEGEPLGEHIQLTQYGAPGPSNARQAAAPPRSGFDPYAAGARPPSVAPPGTAGSGTVPPPGAVATAPIGPTTPMGATFSGSAPPPGMYAAPAPGLPPGQPGLYAPPTASGGFGAGNVAYDPARMSPVAAPPANTAPSGWSQPAPTGGVESSATPYAAAPSDSVAAALQGPPSAGPASVTASPTNSGANGQYAQPRYSEGAPFAAAPVTSGPSATWSTQPPQVAQALDDFGRRTQEMLDNLGRAAGSGVTGGGSAPAPVGAPPSGGGFAGAGGAPGAMAPAPNRGERLDQPIPNQQVGQWSTQGAPATSSASGLPAVNSPATVGAPGDPRLRPPTGGADATSGGLSGPQFPGIPAWPNESTRPAGDAGARPSLFDNNLAPGGTPGGDRLVPEINYGMLTSPAGAPLINGADGRPLPSTGGSPWDLAPPPLPTTTPTSGGALTGGGATAGGGGEANPSLPSVTTPPAATAAGQDPSKLFAVLLAWVLLCGSAAGNLYLFWSYLDVRTKYRSLVRESARGLARRFSAA